jgi:hypothetical protein
MALRTCKACKNTYPLTKEHYHQLNVKGWIGFYYTCKICRNKRKVIYNESRKEITKIYNAEYYRNNYVKSKIQKMDTGRG